MVSRGSVLKKSKKRRAIFERGTFKISTFETLTVFYRLGALGAYLGALLGLSLDLFGGILVSLGAILATLWPSLGYLRLYLGCLGSLLVYLGLHLWVLLVYLGLDLGICWWLWGC